MKKLRIQRDAMSPGLLSIWSLRLLCVLAAALCCASIAFAGAPVSKSADGPGRRVALVIGNANYQRPLPTLDNPRNDAEDIAKALRGFGFKVIERKDQTLLAMNQAIAEFGRRARGAEAALVYYAGHGIQVKNQNYLIPVNAVLESEASIPYQSVNLNQILDEMEQSNSRTNIVMLDACRDNPISGKFRSGPTSGLASPGAIPKGTVIVYSTAPGNVAADGTGRNGLFTAGLLAAFKGDDLSLDGVLTVASAQVEAASGQTQIPYVNGPKTLQKNFQFRVAAKPGGSDIERTFWTSIERSVNAADFEAYLRKYPAGHYATLAENRLQKLRVVQQVPAAGPPGRPPRLFDGRWDVTHTCEALSDKGKSVKGFVRRFPVLVKDGQISGQQGQSGAPGVLAFAGSINQDGTAQITANGRVGNMLDQALSGAQEGSSFSYPLRGTFTQDRGQAARSDGRRSCTATFLRN